MGDKRGHRFGSLDAANERLWHWSQTVPEGKHHRVAYSVEGVDTDTPPITGSFFIAKGEPTDKVIALERDLETWYPETLALLRRGE